MTIGGQLTILASGLEENVELHVELSVPGLHPTVGVGVGGVKVDLCLFSLICQTHLLF